MSHNGPSPDRFLQNNPLARALGLVAWRYDEMFTENAEMAVRYLEPRLRAGVGDMEALLAFEGREMALRLVGPKRKYDTVFGYEER